MFFVNFTSTNNSVTTAQLSTTMGIVKFNETFNKWLPTSAHYITMDHARQIAIINLANSMSKGNHYLYTELFIILKMKFKL